MPTLKPLAARSELTAADETAAIVRKERREMRDKAYSLISIGISLLQLRYKTVTVRNLVFRLRVIPVTELSSKQVRTMRRLTLILLFLVFGTLCFAQRGGGSRGFGGGGGARIGGGAGGGFRGGYGGGYGGYRGGYGGYGGGYGGYGGYGFRGGYGYGGYGGWGIGFGWPGWGYGYAYNPYYYPYAYSPYAYGYGAYGYPYPYYGGAVVSVGIGGWRRFGR
jgi:hypothetical protein